MPLTPGGFDALSLIYIALGVLTLARLVQGWRSFTDARITGADMQLAGGVAFFLFQPPAVLLHEFGHLLAAWQIGATVTGLRYAFYWGEISYVGGPAAPLPHWWVALAGNLASVLLGLAAGGLAVSGRLPAIWNLVLFQFAGITIFSDLVFYPLLCLSPTFPGDWTTIYSFAPGTEVAAAITAGLHGALLLGLILLLRHPAWQARYRRLTGGAGLRRARPQAPATPGV